MKLTDDDGIDGPWLKAMSKKPKVLAYCEECEADLTDYVDADHNGWRYVALPTKCPKCEGYVHHGPRPETT